MKERPILFSAPMVQAILAGNKTQTRRVVKGFDIQGSSSIGHYDWFKNGKWEGAHKTSMSFSDSSAADNCPYGQIGDQLWVRENFQPLLAEEKTWDDMPYVNYKTGEGYTVSYPATDGIVEFVNADDEVKDSVKPSIHMPRWASRIQLEITNIRVERLQDISEADALAEGVFCASAGAHEDFTHGSLFRDLWESINGHDVQIHDADGKKIGMQPNPARWDANPWVWVIEFKRVERPA